MKLKTLKDLELGFVDERIIKSQIKALAIKWVKANIIGEWRAIFKKFFNITSEDLK